ncbi:MAG: DUF393 domain-containing protein [Anaerolineae bacterium]|nr:DUF393 domain-containing protein [Anaerolineae bacterium]
MQRLDSRHRLWLAPFQEPGAPARLGLTFAEAEQAAWAMDAYGLRFRGAAAIFAALAVALGWPWLLRLYELPLLRALADHAYAWVAAHRSRFPGLTPYCQRHPQRCRCGAVAESPMTEHGWRG